MSEMYLHIITTAAASQDHQYIVKTDYLYPKQFDLTACNCVHHHAKILIATLTLNVGSI